MALKSYEEIVRDLHNKIYAPVYLLQGDEPFYIDKISELLEGEVLGDMEKEFNQTVLYGRDCDVLSLVSTAKRYPMMSNYQVVIVKEAQEIKGLGAKEKEDKSSKDKDDKDPLLNYVNNPLTSTVLVFCYKYKNLDKRTKLYKAIEKSGVVFESKKIYDNKIPGWIDQYLAAKKYKIDAKAAQLMADHLGNDLSRVANECDKLLINVKPGETITTQHIETNIGISKDFNVFELQNALGEKDILKVNRIVNYFRANPKSGAMPMLTATLYGYYAKILLLHSLPDKSKMTVASALKVNPFFVEDYLKAARNYSPANTEKAISILREFDLKSKGVDSANTDNGDLLREMTFKLMH
jgi:DNA polymerase-3 subunit delta